MRFIFNPEHFLKFRLPFLFTAFFYSTLLLAQDCVAPENFEANYYNHSKASYGWDYSAEALSYELSIEINNKSYTKVELPGLAAAADIKFTSELKHKDRVHALLTKYCAGGVAKSSSFDFIIIDDAIVYLTGTVLETIPNIVEPVYAVNDNLVPAYNICGRCDPGFFRLESGFYGPYSIAVDPVIGPIEHLRFRKDELCDCIDNAIAAGILNPNGGPGELYNNKPFHCEIIPYVFDKQDCNRGNREAGIERGAIPTTDQSTLHLEIIPNPVSGIAQITYHLTRETEVMLNVFDIAGRLVHSVVNHAPNTTGDHRFEFDASALAPGFYYCQIQAESMFQTIVLTVAR